MDNPKGLTGSKPYSLLALVLSVLVLSWYSFQFYPRYKQAAANATLAWDAAGYYIYLPSAIIYHDLSQLNWGDTVIPKYEPGPVNAKDFGIKVENGNTVLKYTSGLAFAELPFFLAAHAYAKASSHPADGFSLPYQFSIQLGALLISFLGLLLLRRFLLYYYSDSIVAITILIIAIGSNYLNYSAIDGALSHTWLFTLYAALLLFTRSFYLNPRYRTAIAIGALCGWAILIRPTEIISILIPLFWGLHNFRKQTLRRSIQFFSAHRVKLLCAVIACVAIAGIQAVYWKYVSGLWLVYSYGDQSFNWLQPRLFEYALSYRSGWLTYTPVMFFAIAGFLPLWRQGANRLMVLIFSIPALYMVSAWGIWWYAGSGGRAMIQYYPVLAIPLAAMLHWLSARPLRMWISIPVILLFAYINIWFTYHAHIGTLYDANGGMSKEYYWRVIGRWSAPPETLKLRDGRYLYEGPMPANARLIYKASLHGTNAEGKDTMLRISTAGQVSPDFSIPFTQDGAKWIRAQATFHTTEKEWDGWKMLQFLVATWKGSERQTETMVSIQRFMADTNTNTISVDLKLPSGADSDTIKAHFWNPGGNHEVEIENLEVWSF
jgi:hypothetical protein